MSTTDTGAQGVDTAGAGEGEQKEQTFSQADVDRIVKERVQRVQAKYADYEALKTKAGEAGTLEERVAEIEARATAAEARALRSDIAAKHGISPEDAELFLTGTDEATLTAQAQRLAEREADRKKHGNVAPREGETKNTGKGDTDFREFTRSLFGRAD